MSSEKGHLFQGEPDARQRDATLAVGLFRKRYRKLEDREIALHDAIKTKAEELATLIGCLNLGVAEKFEIRHELMTDQFPLPHRNYDAGGVTLAIRHLEDAVYRAVKALTG